MTLAFVCLKSWNRMSGRWFFRKITFRRRYRQFPAIFTTGSSGAAPALALRSRSMMYGGALMVRVELVVFVAFAAHSLFLFRTRACRTVMDDRSKSTQSQVSPVTSEERRLSHRASSTGISISFPRTARSSTPICSGSRNACSASRFWGRVVLSRSSGQYSRRTADSSPWMLRTDLGVGVWVRPRLSV